MLSNQARALSAGSNYTQSKQTEKPPTKNANVLLPFDAVVACGQVLTTGAFRHRSIL